MGQTRILGGGLMSRELGPLTAGDSNDPMRRELENFLADTYRIFLISAGLPLEPAEELRLRLDNDADFETLLWLRQFTWLWDLIQNEEFLASEFFESFRDYR
mgnify:CR=1 FL=1